MQPTTLTIFLLSTLLTVSAAHAGKMYRWVDADGNTHYTDQIPPDQVKRSRQELTDKGVRTNAVARAKTEAEIEKERELERRRAEQQRLIDKQQAADRVLLRTFRSEDDLIMARDGKLAAIDVQIKVTRGNIRRHQRRLSQLQQRAANRERAGRPVPKTLVNEVDATLRQINDAYASIERKEQDKSAIRQVFTRDQKRFRELNNLAPKPLEEKEQETAALPNLANCSGQQACDEAWKRAEAFVRKHATTPMQILSDTIIMTAAPAKERDVSITVSRVASPQSDGAVLFMDLFCKETETGEEHCKSDDVAAIRQAFRPAVGSTDLEQPSE